MPRPLALAKVAFPYGALAFGTAASGEAPLGVVALVCPGLLALHLAWDLWRSRRWLAYGARLGLAPAKRSTRAPFLGDYPTLVGVVGGRQVEVRAFKVGKQSAWRTAIALSVRGADPALRLRLTRQGLQDAFARARGEGVELGEPLFDRKFRIEASSAEHARRALPADARASLIALPEKGEVRVEGGRVEFDATGFHRDAEEARRIVRLLDPLAASVGQG